MEAERTLGVSASAVGGDRGGGSAREESSSLQASELLDCLRLCRAAREALREAGGEWAVGETTLERSAWTCEVPGSTWRLFLPAMEPPVREEDDEMLRACDAGCRCREGRAGGSSTSELDGRSIAPLMLMLMLMLMPLLLLLLLAENGGGGGGGGDCDGGGDQRQCVLLSPNKPRWSRGKQKQARVKV